MFNFPGSARAGMSSDNAQERQAERVWEAQSVHGLPADYHADNPHRKQVAAAGSADSRPASWLERFFRRVVYRRRGRPAQARVTETNPL